MKPTIGRIVHVNLNSQILAAIIVKVWNDTCVNLAVFDANGSHSTLSSAVQGSGDREWSWPPRV